MMNLLTFMICLVLILMSVAFVTLMERKFLSFSQLRMGPNKVSTMGILQPISDAMKLYTKEMSTTFNINKGSFFLCPCLSLTISLILWISLPMFKPLLSLKSSLLMFLSILGMSVYPILMAGWSSNSNFSLLGSIRSLAQTISYEVSLIFIILSYMVILSTTKFSFIVKVKNPFMFLFFIQGMMMIISSIAELNRTPFDFAEGESELVSGFNTEYSSGNFAMIFMSEYMMILFFSTMLTILLLNMSNINMYQFITNIIFITMFIWSRTTLPRYRYDKLMNLCWKVILPMATMNLMIIFILSIMKF